jgi:hypothetical protein
MKKELGLIILGIIAIGAALYFLVFKRNTGNPESPDTPPLQMTETLPMPKGEEMPMTDTTMVNHALVGEIPMMPSQAYMGEQVTPIILVQQGTEIKSVALNEIPKGAYIDSQQVIHVPVATTAQTLIVPNPSLGTLNVGTAGSNGTPFTSDSLNAKGIPNDFSWVSPELRATNIDPAILQRAPAGGTSLGWVVTVGADGRAYAREQNNKYGDAVFVATPTGWQLFSGTPPQDAPIGMYGDVHKTPYGNAYTQEYWNKYGGEVLAGVYD